ncbi:hypothetical protein NQ315_012388 [Exocentrus adspersus]|uniref:Aquaporin n=1 Tax=Exocentrus adspersus TaxID=1586481 RepID=A0AAV8VMW7_9CUCU|nr:hypothetical protein NQ315_012388 [Exocentrus adspersus]
MLPSGYQICVLKLDNGVTLIQGFFIEFTVTFVLMLVVSGTMDVKNNTKIDSSPLRMGLTVSGFVFAAVS